MKLKEKIIAEALRQFSTKGFMATSTSDIIEAVGTSKGGLYNHFSNKEQLFHAALQQAQMIWRERNLKGLDETDAPIDKIIMILKNYRDFYLADSDNFPGGCIFVNFTVELSDQRPHLAEKVNEGFCRFKNMLKRLLDDARRDGTLRPEVETGNVVEVVFAGLLGACVIFTSDKSMENLKLTIGTLIEYIEGHRI